MKSKSVSLFACGLLALCFGTVSAQLIFEDREWNESTAPPPPAFNVEKLVTFEVSPNSELVFGVDPASVNISQSDGVVRYVMVASKVGGARNVMYEGIRCATGEVKTYARYLSTGRWDMVKNPEWRTMFGYTPSKHSLRFARSGACDGTALPASVAELVNRLKNPNFLTTDLQ